VEGADAAAAAAGGSDYSRDLAKRRSLEPHNMDY